MVKPTGKEMVGILKEEKNPIKLAEKMDDFVNNFSVDSEGFIETLKEEDESLKIRFATISLLWIKKLDYLLTDDWYDLRNKYSVETGHEISLILGKDLENFHPEYKGLFLESTYGKEKEEQPYEVTFVDKFSRSHRTLQQTFSGIVFHWLTVMNEVMEDEFLIKASKRIKDNVDGDIYHTPMI